MVMEQSNVSYKIIKHVHKGKEFTSELWVLHVCRRGLTS